MMTENRAKALAFTVGALSVVAWAFRSSPGRDVTARRAHSSRTVTIRCTAAALYAFWSAPGNLPKFLRGLRSVEIISPERQRWTMDHPRKKLRVKMDIVADEPGVRFEWRTASRAPFDGGGSLTLAEAPGQRGTEARLSLYTTGRAAKAMAAFHRLFGASPAQLAMESLRDLKALIEAGEIPQAVRS